MKRDVNEKKVWIKLQGGLGNQLYQYAFGNLIASRNNFELIVDCKEMNVTQSSRGVLDFILPGKFVNKNSSLNNFFLKKPPIKFNRVVTDDSFSLKYLDLDKPNSYFEGFFQFYSIAAEFLSKFPDLLLKSESRLFREKQSEILSVQPIVLHVRRGDYKDNPHWGLLRPDYYVEGIMHLRNKPQESIWIFSDEIESVYKEFTSSTIFNVTTKDDKINWFPANIKLTAAETLKLISKSNRIVIGNSTFSAWSAYLNQNARIVAPKQFYFNQDSRERLDPSWHSVESKWM